MADTTSSKPEAPTADETPKKEVAKKLVSTKRQYFFPYHGKSIEAESLEKATALLEKDNNRKDGDA